MNKTKHTELPWSLDDRKHLADIWGTQDDCDKLIATIAKYDGLLGVANAEFIIRACNSHYELLKFAKNFEIQEKDDGLWLILHGNGTTGQVMFNLGRKEGLAPSVAKFLEQDRKAAIAKTEEK